MENKKKRCIICNSVLTNNKTKIGQYCKAHKPKKAWDTTEARFKKANTRLIKKCESIHFNIHYEFEQLKKLVDQAVDAKPQELSFFVDKLDNIISTAESFAACVIEQEEVKNEFKRKSRKDNFTRRTNPSRN